MKQKEDWVERSRSPQTPRLQFGAESVGELRALTGLRGVAALLVVCFHVISLRIPYAALRGAVLHGYIWVDAFFVLSGFVMALAYPVHAGPGLLRRHLHFLGRRLARIYPLYIVTAMLAMAIVQCGWSWLPGFRFAAPRGTLVANILLLQNFGWLLFGLPTRWAVSLNMGSWSISTEWGNYLIYPALALTAAHRRVWPALLLGTAAVATISVLALSPFPGLLGRSGPLDFVGGSSPHAWLRCVAEFSLGLLAWRVRDAYLVRVVLGGRAAANVILVAIFGLLFWRTSDLAIVLAFPLLLLALQRPDTAAARLLASHAVHRLGVWSYSIYLIHTVFLLTRLPNHVRDLMPGPVTGDAALLALIVGLSALSYHLIERPGRALLTYGLPGLRWRITPSPASGTTAKAPPH
jgi:peptidoglycan/LPS O-acetylase OafA/YrhL